MKDCTSSCLPLKNRKLKDREKRGSVTQLVHLSPVTQEESTNTMPEQVQQLLQDNATLFQLPTELPPTRPFDHKIPLIPRVKLLNVKPYKYSPTQKDEIERQITEMLKNDIIQHSNSPFSSQVILVKKKDVTWRFCTDYRQLNALHNRRAWERDSGCSALQDRRGELRAGGGAASPMGRN